MVQVQGGLAPEAVVERRTSGEHRRRVVTRRLDIRLVLRPALALLAVAIIWSCALWMDSLHPRVAIAAAFDIVVTASAAVYWISRSRRAALSTAVVGATIAKLAVLPDAARLGLAIAGGLELAAIALIVVRVRRARAAWRVARADGASGHDALERAIGATGLPARVADIFATETAVIAHAFAGWRAPKTASRFTVHGAWATYMGVFLALTLVEAPLVHVVLVAAGHATAAWTLTVLSIYSAVWLVGDFHALRAGGVTVTPDRIELAVGVRWRASFPRAALVRAERGGAGDALDLSILGADVVLHLCAPVDVRGMFGRRRTASAIAISADDPATLLAALTPRPASS